VGVGLGVGVSVGVPVAVGVDVGGMVAVAVGEGTGTLVVVPAVLTADTRVADGAAGGSEAAVMVTSLSSPTRAQAARTATTRTAAKSLLDFQMSDIPPIV
jgi:hypothetical protein